MPLKMVKFQDGTSQTIVKFQDGTSQTTDSWNQLTEAKKIIAELQKENEELKALNNQQTPGIWNLRKLHYNLFKNYFLGKAIPNGHNLKKIVLLFFRDTFP